MIGFEVNVSDKGTKVRPIVEMGRVDVAKGDEAITAATAAMTAVADMVAPYYLNLVERGVPDDYARSLTDKMYDMLMAKVAEGVDVGMERARQQGHSVE